MKAQQKRWILKIALAGILVLIVIGLFEIFAIVTAKPKVTVDYLAEYNRISRSANYDPRQNAADLYDKALNNFVQMPRQLYQVDYADWPDDFNQLEQDLLQKWLIENENCFRKFIQASQKPYYWVKRYSTNDNKLFSIAIPELIDLHHICEAIEWNAKIKAVQGKYTEAFDDLLVCYRSGFQQYDKPSLIFELQMGLLQQGTAMKTVNLILKKTSIPTSVLKSFQQTLEEISDTHTYFIDFAAEKLTLYDILQRTYVYKPDGTGRLSWKHKSDFYTMCGDDNPWTVIKSCFIGPTQNEVKKEIDSYYEKIMTVFTLAPWELNQTQPDFFEKLFWDCQRGTLILRVYGLDYRQAYYGFYNTQAQLQSLLTTIAVMRYRQDKGHLPDTLDELVKAGYLRQLPIDPYSGKSLVYSVEGKDFKIYSISNNFKDDGGKGIFLPRSLGSGNRSSDLVFWPPTEPRKKYLERLRVRESNQPLQKPSD